MFLIVFLLSTINKLIILIIIIIIIIVVVIIIIINVFMENYLERRWITDRTKQESKKNYDLSLLLIFDQLLSIFFQTIYSTNQRTSIVNGRFL